jgi:uncharacterized alkaline shock family protein YloU
MEESHRDEPSESFETIQEDSGLGSISINNDVVANIVAMAAREVAGVVNLASGGSRTILPAFSGANAKGGQPFPSSETPEGAYHIGIKLILTFGVQLAKVAQTVFRIRSVNRSRT